MVAIVLACIQKCFENLWWLSPAPRITMPALCAWLVWGVANLSAFGWPAGASAQTFTTLYSFQGPPDGAGPLGLVVDRTTGNLYGLTRVAGDTAPCPADSLGNRVDGVSAPGCGVLFELTPPARKGLPWTETVVHAFTGGADGAYPDVKAGLVFHKGSLYGTTEFGGYANNTTWQTGCGTVFKFDLATKTLQTIYSFTGGADSGRPYAGVVFDTTGTLYGTVEGGDGARPADDLVYALTPPNGQSGWTFTAIHPSTGGDSEIRSPVAVDKAGNLYGMTKQAALFKLTPPTYAETTLYSFDNGAAGDQTGLTVHNLADGGTVLYGVTRRGGGPQNAGTVFKFDPATATLTTLHTFTGGADGAAPFAPVVLHNGVLYARLRAVPTRSCNMSTLLRPARSPAAECGALWLPRRPKRCEKASARKRAYRRT
jgi:uncharacterized repeat protein (TIGR03803 family)